MILALALSLAVQGSDPPVSVKINHDQFSSGDHARVYVETAQDGYLVVLHADPDGRIRVLFPTDPRDDDFIRGGRRFEVRGRSDRDAFQVEGDEGSGTVLAAVSSDPLNFDAFVRNDHWDFRALGSPSGAAWGRPCGRHTTMGVAQIRQSAIQHSSSSKCHGVTCSAVHSGHAAEDGSSDTLPRVRRREVCPASSAIMSRVYAGVAQSAEHGHGKSGVAGSIPASSSKPRRGGRYTEILTAA